MTSTTHPTPGRTLRVWQFLAVVIGYLVIVQGLAIALAAGDDDRGAIGSVDALVRGIVVPVGIGAAYVLVVTAFLGKWQRLFTDPRRLRPWTWWLVAALGLGILAIANYGGLAAAGLLHALVLLVAVLLVGFSEELLFRGIGLDTFRAGGRREVMVAVWSSLAFGLAHGTNAVVTGDVPGALLQVVLTTTVGAVLYLVLRVTGSLVAAMAAHALWDFSVLSTQIDLSNTHDIVNAAPIVIIGILVTVMFLRKRLTREPAHAVGAKIDEIRDAIARLRAAATHDDDAPRGEVADRLARRFEGIDGPADARAAARDALRLYRGGMGSFSDTGTAVMDAAVERLRRALERAV
ncbi:type II CAAX endopeptidase family protein [Microbacterium sp. LS_15]|uniref:CPBP family intramembrane glutamic endopeptidase n=1 Tax=Microbacterium sp. LS_15 TaxID=3055790 RepID=UPI0035C0295F